MVEKIRMNVNDTLELDYLVEKVDDSVIDVTPQPSDASFSLDYLKKQFGVFDPSDTGTYQLNINGQTIEVEVTDIPDSVVSRSAFSDNETFSQTQQKGLAFTSTVEWPSIGAEISGNTSGVTNAYVYRVSDDTLMGQTNFAAKSSGDAFVIEDLDLQPNTEYSIVVDADGAEYTEGRNSSATYPITSSDGQLELTAGAFEGSSTTDGFAYNLVRVGNVGFS